MPRNRVRTHFSGANVACPVCRTAFVPKRRWQAFCSDSCRKAFWRMNKGTGTYIDIRKALEEIQTSLRAIESRMGIERGKS